LNSYEKFQTIYRTLANLLTPLYSLILMFLFVYYIYNGIGNLLFGGLIF